MTADEELEILNTMVLASTTYFHPAGLVDLYNRLGSATAVIEHHDNIKEVIPDAAPYLVKGLKDIGNARQRAEQEMEYDSKHGIRPIPICSPDYPQRLRQCADAPLVVYYLGNADLNPRHSISIIGTRKCTAYGRDLIQSFARDLRQLCPNIVIFSGLAYGIDVCAHRAALDNGMETVGVLAHGLDEIYPRAHRDTAVAMIKQGGLLTEYMSHTQPFPKNFVKRNRIIAGCTDATILVESADKGGGLITCNIARSYDRDVFAFPGAVGAKYSEGCNKMIRQNVAALITSADDFVEAMGWNDGERLKKAKKKGIERDLFPDLSDEERAVVSTLEKANDLQLNILTAKTGITVSRLSALLFEMELKGIIKPLAGGTYHLVNG